MADPEEDGLVEMAEKENAEPDRPLPSARWQCPDEEWIINEGLEMPAPGQGKGKQVERGEKRVGGGGGAEEMILEDSDDEAQDVKPNLSRSISDPSSSTSQHPNGVNKRKANSTEPQVMVKPTKKRKKSPTPVPPPHQPEARKCIMCERDLLGSEVAFNNHVNACLGESLSLFFHCQQR